MLYVFFKAPFGAFKPFQSVELHATADFITHSAAYGLLLGFAGVDRYRKKDFIGAQIAIGQINKPLRGRVLQQLHKMPKQNPGEEVLERAKGNKPKIDVFRRDYLCKLKGFIGLRHEELETLVKKGINEPSNLSYWGLPFMGDNNFFVERIEAYDNVPQPCRWFNKYNGQSLSQGERLYYLSIWTDYETNARSNGSLFALTDESNEPPQEAWVVIEEAKSTND
jgi:CRISPR-associated protein Cas5t